MHLRQKIMTEWVTSIALDVGETRVVEVGNVLSGVLFLSLRSHQFLTFSLISELACSVEIQGDFTPTFATVDTPYTIAVPANTFWTPYNMAAPWNQTGYLVLVKPITRVRLVNTAGPAHSFTRFYAKAWG